MRTSPHPVIWSTLAAAGNYRWLLSMSGAKITEWLLSEVPAPPPMSLRSPWATNHVQSQRLQASEFTNRGLYMYVKIDAERRGRENERGERGVQRGERGERGRKRCF